MQLAKNRIADRKRLFCFNNPSLDHESQLQLEGELPEDASKEQQEQRLHDLRQKILISKTFLRYLGFRRVGFSKWFAHSAGEKGRAPHAIDAHPSHQMTHDYDPPFFPDSAMSEEWSEVFQALKDVDTSDEDCLSKLVAATRGHNPAPMEGPVVDKCGNTALHLATSLRRVRCIEHIMSSNPSLAEVRNIRTQTALQMLYQSLNAPRVSKGKLHRYVDISDEFQGHSPEAVRCLCLIGGIEYVDLTTLAEDDVQIGSPNNDARQSIIQSNLQYKYGCTCRRCIRGFMSPNMGRHLAFCASSIDIDTAKNAVLQGNFPYNNIGPGDQLKQFLESSKRATEDFHRVFQQFVVCLC